MTEQEKIEIFANYLPYGVKYKLPLESNRYDSILEDEPFAIALPFMRENDKMIHLKTYNEMFLIQKEPFIAIEENKIFLGQMQSSLGFDLDDVFFDEVKLILHPLSDLTNPIKVDGYNDGKEFVPYCMIEDLGLAKTVSLSFASVVFSFNLYYGISISERLSCIKYDLEEEIDKINKLPHSIIKLLYKWHFDIHGLIEQCLAIDINTLK